MACGDHRSSIARLFATGAGAGLLVGARAIKIETEGWERDTSVTEPTEPSFTDSSGIT